VSASAAIVRTRPPGGDALIALYDGRCRFCIAGAQRLARAAPPGRVELQSFQDDGVLDRFPGVAHAACMERIHVIAPDGRVYAGMEAVARVVRTARVIGAIAYLYYVPGVRALADLAYRVIAANRYRIAGRHECDPNGTCHLHT